jgi:hypothetical protein
LDTTDLMDPVDGFLDGVYGKSTDLTSRSCEDLPYSEGFSGGNRPAPPAKHIPQCRTHNLPCRLCTVKKTSNKGRKFWVCSLPREEQCQHFQWEENSVQVSRFRAIGAPLASQSRSQFVCLTNPFAAGSSAGSTSQPDHLWVHRPTGGVVHARPGTLDRAGATIMDGPTLHCLSSDRHQVADQDQDCHMGS